MKIKKEVAGGLIVIVLIAATVAVITGIQREGRRAALAKRIAQVSSNAIPTSVDELKKAIGVYEQRMESYLQDADKAGSYWKILATRLQDKKLHREALAALERGIAYNPEDPTLQYLTGVSAAMTAKSALDFDGNSGSGTRYYALAESAYLNAIKMDAQYTRPLYGLGVLYVFELEQPASAVPHLRRLLELRPSDIDGMFVLARAYVMLEDYEAAMDMYDRIISTAKDKTRRNEAEQNKRIIMEQYYG
ncbi:MAG: tetratricopeptide repeat protein [Treponema sp.]|jgi:tetratricopeptide (TPR) repeat protein|nr:tetratricopeptide repeat protein [Treponema sp.]